MKQKILFLNIMFVLLVGVGILFFFNGMVSHPIKEIDLEQTFLDQVYENGLAEGQVIKNETHGNSTTFLFQNTKGEIACGTYVKSLYSRNWRQEKLYTSKMSVFNHGEISYDVNDKLSVYEVTCKITDEPAVLFGEAKSLVLSIKSFGVCVVLMAGFAGRLFGSKFRKK